jgi:hypothetical protein
MKSKNRKDASPETARTETATPFFARYLEGQSADAEAKVSEGRSQSNFTFKEDARSTKKGGAKKGGAKKGGAKASAASASKNTAAAKAAPVQTLKYPSDGDELVLYPYHLEAVNVKDTQRRPVTLKFPSDNDEGDAYYAVYADAGEAPKATAKTAAKPKDASVRLTRKKPKG